MWQTKRNLTKYILTVVIVSEKVILFCLIYEKDKINGFHMNTELETILIFLKKLFLCPWGLQS